MNVKRTLVGLATTALAAGAVAAGTVAAGVAAAPPGVYHDMVNPAALKGASVQSDAVSINRVYHDM